MAFNISKKQLITFFLSFFVLILTLFALQSTMKQLFPLRTIHNLVSQTLTRELSVQTSIEDVHLTLFPRPAIRVMNVLFSDPASGDRWIEAESLEIKLKLLPLLKGSAQPDRILVNHPLLRIRRDIQGDWHFMGHPSLPDSGEELSEPNQLADSSINSLVLKDATIMFVDQKYPAQNPTILLQKTDFYFRKFSKDSPIDFKIKGDFPHKLFELNSFSMTGTLHPGPAPLDFKQVTADTQLAITNMPVEMLHPHLQELLNIQPVTGKIDLKANLTLNPYLEFDMSGKLVLRDYQLLASRYALQPITGKIIDMNFVFSKNEEAFTIRHWALGLEDSVIWGHGHWAHDRPEKPIFGLSLHAADLSFEEVRKFLPDKHLPIKIAHMLHNAGSSGSLDIPLFEISGGKANPAEKESEGKGLVYSLKVIFHNFGMHPESEFHSIDALKGELDLAPGIIEFREITGSYGRTQVERIHGILSPLSSRETDLNVKARINLEEVRQLIRQFPDAIRNRILVSNLRQAAGYANVDMQFTPSDKEESPIAIEGKADLIGAGFSFPFSPFILSGIYGNLSFQKNDVQPFKLKAKIDMLPAQVQGSIHDFFSTAPHLKLKISTTPSENEMIKWFPFFKGKLSLKGEHPQFTLYLNGTSSAMNYDVRMDLSQTALTFSDWMTKEQGVTSLLHFSGLARDAKEMTISHGSLEIAKEIITFSGKIHGLEKRTVNLDVRSDHVSLHAVETCFADLKDCPPESFLKGRLNFSFQPNVRDSLTIHGELTLNKVGFTPRYSLRPLNHVKGTLYFSGKEVSAHNIDCTWGDLPLTLDLSIPQISTPVPELRIQIPHADLRPLVQEIFSPESDSFNAYKKPLKNVRFQAELLLKNGLYNRFQMQDLHVQMDFDRGILTLPSFETYGLGGTVKGKGRIDFVSGKEPLFQADAQVSDVSTEKYLELFPHSRTFYAGIISGTIGANGSFYPDLEKTAREMEGKAHLLIQSSQERNYIMNLAQEFGKGMEIMLGKKNALFRIVEYKYMSGDFTIHDAKFHSTNFIIDQYHKFDVSGMTIDKLTAAVPIRIKYNIKAAGSFDFLDTGLDCYLIAQPFSIADRFLKKVPLAGKILTGKDESIYSAYFQFKGRTSYKYRGTEQGVHLNRISFDALPETYKNVLKVPK